MRDLEVVNFARSVTVTAGTGFVERIRLSLVKGEIAFIKKIIFHATGPIVWQTVYADPEKELTDIVNSLTGAGFAALGDRDVLAFNMAETGAIVRDFPEPGYKVARDLACSGDVPSSTTIAVAIAVFFVRQRASVKEIEDLIIARR